MKKYLFATTAALALLSVASNASAQEPISVTVGGYLQFDAASISQDKDDNLRSNDFRTSSEIHVRAEGTADNGLVYGANIELEADQNSGQNNGDENYIYASGGWGKVELGDNSGVADGEGLGVIAPRDFGLGGVAADDESYLDFVSQGSNIAFVGAELFELSGSESSTKVSYYSPVFNGFQAGASFAPEVDSGNSVTRFENFDSDSTTLQSTNTTQFYENLIEVAAKYSGEFQNVGFQVGAGYFSADAKNDVDTNTGPIELNDIGAYTVGLAASYAGFTISGNYVDYDDALTSSNSTDGYEETDAISFGVQYETGPVVLGLNHLDASSEDDQNTLSDLEYKATSLGVSYAAAPGWVAYAEGTKFDAEDGTSNNDDGNVVILGTRLSF